MKSIREQIFTYAKQTWNTEAEYPWERTPRAAVLRHTENKKWYGILMDVRGDRLGLDSEDWVDILNVKCDPVLIGALREQEGFFPAYHMNKENWITILLDGIVSAEQIYPLLSMSFAMTAGSGKEERAAAGPKCWLVPANPRYYDVESEFAQHEIIRWKQSSKVAVGDIVYIYMGAPVSSVLYRCQAVEVDIPYQKNTGYVHIQKAMRIRLLQKYAPGEVSRERLKEHGVYAVRGPRSMPASLARELEREGREPI